MLGILPCSRKCPLGERVCPRFSQRRAAGTPAGSDTGKRCGGRLVVPRHPGGRIIANAAEVPSERDQIVEGIDSCQAAGVDQTHEQITDLGAIFGFVEQRVVTMAD